MHCSYEKDIVCDDPVSHHSGDHHYYQQHQQQSDYDDGTLRHHKKQSHHQSPHSHHSHSLHSSPHQTMTHQHYDHERTATIDNSEVTRHHSHNQQQHHHHRRRRRHHHHHNGGTGGGGGGTIGSGHGHHHGGGHGEQRRQHHESGCPKRHRSATDVSTTSINTCHEPSCPDREVQEILIRKSCCTSSRTELAQYFAEDLYGTSRRPSSCCTSSDYCYHTDSTSLYGSRSSLSRQNSIKSGSVTMRSRKRVHHRQPSYTSISLRGLNASQPNSQLGSLTSIFDRAREIESGKMIVSPSKVTIEHQSSGKDGGGSNKELPEYACSPSPIRWSFLADGSTRKSPTDYESAAASAGGGHGGGDHRSDHQHDRAGTSGSRKCRDSPLHIRGGAGTSDEYEESTTVLYHQEGEAYNNCCSNYIQCNSYLDHDLQITSEDIHEYLSKGNQQGVILNNSKNYPFQPCNALEFQYKNNFNNNPAAGAGGGGGASLESRRSSTKETNLNQNSTDGSTLESRNSTPLSPTNINLSSSSNNINIVFNSYLERNANEVKFINTSRENVVSAEAHHSGYLPYTYPSYDYTNMSSNSQFDKPLGIDEIAPSGEPSYKSAGRVIDGVPSISSPAVVTFESFETEASDNNLLSHRSSLNGSFNDGHVNYQFSPTSPASAASSVSGLNGGGACAGASGGSSGGQNNEQRHRYFHHHHFTSSQHRWHHVTDNFKFSNAFKGVRKRARKCADYLKKK